MLDETLNTEMQLHRDYRRRLGITESDLERIAPAPVTQGYTRHLLTVAYSGSIAAIVAAVLPCQLGYAKIGTALAGESRSGANPTYAEWIKTYSSQEFVSGAEKLGSLLDDLTAGWPARELAYLETLLLTSSRYEFLFWEMAWPQSSWPVKPIQEGDRKMPSGERTKELSFRLWIEGKSVCKYGTRFVAIRRPWEAASASGSSNGSAGGKRNGSLSSRRLNSRAAIPAYRHSPHKFQVRCADGTTFRMPSR